MSKQIINGKEVDILDAAADREHPQTPLEGQFVPGQIVNFKGLLVGAVHLKPVKGKLRAITNVSSPGAVGIEGDEQRLIFNANGSLYCHAQHGILLEHVRELESE
jgi:hypothetical protein